VKTVFYLMAGGAVLALALSTSARATGQISPKASRPPVVSAGDLSQRPNNYEMQANYPAQALSEHVGGRAQVRCIVASTGALVDCTIQSEEPTGQGFGQATLNITQFCTARPKTLDGTATQGAVFQMTVVWVPPPTSRSARQGSY
jgi:TonB family protein